MISEQTLAQAVDRGIITAGQAMQLRALASGSEAAAPNPDDEQLRFITGFADIFVTIGVGLFLGGIVYLMIQQPPWQQASIVAVASWLIAELFTRRMRMALPSIVLLLTFTASIGTAVLMYIAGDLKTLGDYLQSLFLGDGTHVTALLASSLSSLAAAALHYYRFRVPITVAAGGAALTATILSLLAFATPGLVYSLQRPIVFGCGVLFFLLAMWFDRRDLRRQTRLSDIAFWLHMLAAPLLVHSLAGYFARSVMLTLNAALLVLAIVGVLGLIAILIDRRALLVSGLAYLAIAFSSVVRETAATTTILPLTILALGAFMLLISALWKPLRRSVLSLAPAMVAGWVPPARANSSG